jgi:glutamyl-tRNA synthetase
MGYLPEAVVNYIALLGWSPKGNEEIFSMEALVNAFSLAGIGRSASVFDYKKLDWVNSQYLAQMSDEEFARTALSYAHGLGPLTDKWPLIAPLLKTRLSRLTEIDEKTAFLNQVPDYDLALYVNKKNKTDYAVSFDTLKKVIPLLEAAADWTSPALFALIASYAEESAVKVGRIMWPLRVALSGLAATPGGATDIMEILGKEESLKRLKGALPLLEAQADA